MTIQAANSFLKMLEEPGERVVFILLCRSPESLPKTIVSRCQVLPFRPLAPGSCRIDWRRRESLPRGPRRQLPWRGEAQ